MRVEVDGVEYTISMTWQDNENARFFVWIDDDLKELKLKLFRRINDFQTHITPQEVRQILAQEIAQLLDYSSGDRG